jgi:hypothetical protein
MDGFAPSTFGRSNASAVGVYRAAGHAAVRAIPLILPIPLIPGAAGFFSMPTVRIPLIPGLVKTLGG